MPSKKNGDQLIMIDEILQLLPHRYPFLLVDRVLEYQEPSYIHAIKNVTINEPFFNGHFPGHPVMPGVLLVEALAQAGAILAYVSMKSSPKEHIFYMASIDNVKFKQMVKPGDQLHLHVKLLSQKAHFSKFTGEVIVDGKVVCSAEMLSAMGKTNP